LRSVNSSRRTPPLALGGPLVLRAARRRGQLPRLLELGMIDRDFQRGGRRSVRVQNRHSVLWHTGLNGAAQQTGSEKRSRDIERCAPAHNCGSLKRVRISISLDLLKPDLPRERHRFGRKGR
jgi:hypothetical protein